MTELFQDKERRKGLIGTILIHLILLLLFIFFGLTHMLPIPETGMVVDFGMVEDGFGEETPTAPVEEPEPVTEAVSTPVEQVVVSEDIMTQETVETVTVKDEEKKVDEVKEVVPEAEPIKPQKKVEDRFRKMKQKMEDKKAKETSQGEGDTSGDGDAGNPEGTQSDNYLGIPGDGNSFSLGNRKSKHLPSPDSNIQEEGKVIVAIKVDRFGNVVWAKAGSRGSTISDLGLYKRAEEAAYKAKFSIDKNATEEQLGSITYIFMLN
ncbi:MAG: hypothetical protein HRT72_14055 [Flavobacteriales bacterium]|nr:hypothetical protein [Flavobacteriales bacterium]